MKLDRDRPDDEIPTSSMADIAFLLIVFFMVTTTFTATRGLDFALPEDDDDPPVVEKEESVLVEIMPNGELIVDQDPMGLHEIIPYLKPKLERNPKKPVIIRPDIATPYRFMVQVYDELRQWEDYGLEQPINISVPTQREIQSFWY
ncbi:MAG: biopolymer transporter ExbD [Holophagales bacterium]|nr:biopolymer transporter ExbD [Holophagales bacterium]MXX62060.1 biopolymer transporter ExbD [Holophagales bacterium]MYC09132.1 biopolymer transporter ExbD [Holophagales bacterium]MYD22916.1 biopolymer transporter ExbD [Holophagales bacterium]MYI32377.1 biopolymer transporter ExbD [Holophagales bacterium]